MFASKNHFAGILDHWTSVGKTEFLSIGVTYLTDNEIQTKCIYANEVADNKTTTTRSVFQCAIKEMGIGQKVKGVVTTDDAFKDHIYSWNVCASHQLNLGLKTTFDDVDKVAKFGNIKQLDHHCRALVEYVNQSSKQPLLELLDNTLKQPCEAQFDSKPLVYSSIIKNRLRFEQLKDGDIERLSQKINFSLLERVNSIIQLVCQSRSTLSIEKRPTFNLVYPVKCKLLKELGIPDRDSGVAEFKLQLRERMEQKFIVSMNHKIAAFLTPKFRDNRELFTDSDRNEIQQKIRMQLNFTQSCSVPSQQSRTEVHNLKSDFFADFMDFDDSSVTHPNDELDLYSKFRCDSQNVLEFWNKNALKFPKLSAYALDLLIRPATTSFIGRLFSEAGPTIDKHRNKLNYDSVESNLFIRSNKDMLDTEEILRLMVDKD